MSVGDAMERMWREEKARADAAEARARAAESELAVTRAVLEDLTTERGVPWVSLVLRRRDAVLRWLKSWYAEECPHCRVDVAEAHRAECGLAELLRALGGPEETQRQVDAAWGEAARERPQMRFSRPYDAVVAPDLRSVSIPRALRSKAK